MSSLQRFACVITLLAFVSGVTSYVYGSSGTASTAPGPLGPAPDIPVRSENKPATTAIPPHMLPTAAAPGMPEVQPVPPQVPEPRKSRQSGITSFRANLENFRVYRGEKSPAIFTALISREITPTLHQKPPIALSDGKTTLKIIVAIDANDGNSPNFALTGAKLISLKKDPALPSNWIIEALPPPNSIKASLTILTSSKMIEYPLNLAPPIAGISALEADFAVFLKDSGASPPKRDLNGDGKHDYLDDFIYTANYLVRKNAEVRNTK